MRGLLDAKKDSHTLSAKYQAQPTEYQVLSTRRDAARHVRFSRRNCRFQRYTSKLIVSCEIVPICSPHNELLHGMQLA